MPISAFSASTPRFAPVLAYHTARRGASGGIPTSAAMVDELKKQAKRRRDLAIFETGHSSSPLLKIASIFF